MTLKELETIFQKCRSQKYFTQDFMSELDKIESNLKNDKFTACIAGGFSHGKTRLLNRLLETDVFPEDVLPATTVLTEVSYGPVEKLVFMSAQEKTSYEFGRVNLQIFCAGQQRGDADGILAVEYPAKFLEPGIMLVDTPGLDDLLEARANLTFAALQECDAALVTISALAPLSLAEKTFIETYLHGRSMPKIAVVVTFLDQLPQADAQRILQFLHPIIAKAWPEAELWTATWMPAQIDSITDANGIEAIRQRITSWAEDPALEKLRIRRAARVLANALQGNLADTVSLLDNLRDDRKTREQKIRSGLEKLSARSSEWLDLRRGFVQRGKARSRELQQMLTGRADKIFSLAASDSRQSFDASLRLNLEQLVAETSQDLQRKLQEDVEWLLGQIRGRFGVEPVLKPHTLQIRPDFAEINLPAASAATKIFEQFRDLDKDIVDKMIIFLPIPPVARPILRQIAHWLLEFGKNMLLGDPHMDKNKITAEINKFLADLETQILALVDSLYELIADEVRKEQDAWLKEQENFLQSVDRHKNMDSAMNELSRNIAETKTLLAMLEKE